MELINKGVRGLDSTNERLEVCIVQDWLRVDHFTNNCYIGLHLDVGLLGALIPVYGECNVMPLFL